MRFHPRHDLVPHTLGHHPGDSLAAGATLVSGTPVKAIANLAGAARARIRLKTTANGSLTLAYLRPDQPREFTIADALVYDAAPSPVAVTGGTEAVMDLDLYGEHGAVVIFTPSANGAVTWADISQV